MRPLEGFLSAPMNVGRLRKAARSKQPTTMKNPYSPYDDSDSDPFPLTAARFSLVMPLLMIVFAITCAAIAGRNPRYPFVIPVCGLMALTGFILGVVGLFGVRRHEGLLARSLCGVIINGVICAVFVMGFIKVRAEQGSKPSTEQRESLSGDKAKAAAEPKR